MKMLNIMILNEYKRNFYRLLNEGAAEMYRDAYYPEVDDYLLEKIIEIDPDSNGDNLSDYGKLLLKLKPDMRDIEQVRQDIEVYAKADKNGVEVPVVNTIEELHYAAVDLSNANAHMSNDEIANKEQSLDCPVVYSDGEFNVIEICDRESAVYYGKGTMWVWGANNGDMFDQYAQRGKIYVIFEKSAGNKYSAINLGKRIRLTDERDEPADKSRFPQQLLNAIMGVNESKKKTKKMLQEKSSLPMSNNDFEIVFEDASWKIVIPKTFAAAVKWGKHTAWDTSNAREGERYFNYYNERGPLYIIINKETKEKYQYHKDAGLFDAMDSEVDFNQLPQEIVSKVVGVNENKVLKLTQNELISILSEAVENKIKNILLNEEGLKSINYGPVEVIQMIDNGMFDTLLKKYIANPKKEVFHKIAQQIIDEYNLRATDSYVVKMNLLDRLNFIDSKRGNEKMFNDRKDLDKWAQEDRDDDVNAYLTGYELQGDRKPVRDISQHIKY